MWVLSIELAMKIQEKRGVNIFPPAKAPAIRVLEVAHHDPTELQKAKPIRYLPQSHRDAEYFIKNVHKTIPISRLR